MNIAVNPCATVAAIADQLAQPIVRQRTRRLEPDWESLREFARQLARETRRVTPYVPARVTDGQFDADRAVDSREWADE